MPQNMLSGAVTRVYACKHLPRCDAFLQIGCQPPVPGVVTNAMTVIGIAKLSVNDRSFGNSSQAVMDASCLAGMP